MTDGEIRELPSNRGRWGADDELGTLNLITDEVAPARSRRRGPAALFPGPPGPRDSAARGRGAGDNGVTGGLPGDDVHRFPLDRHG